MINSQLKRPLPIPDLSFHRSERTANADNLRWKGEPLGEIWDGIKAPIFTAFVVVLPLISLFFYLGGWISGGALHLFFSNLVPVQLIPLFPVLALLLSWVAGDRDERFRFIRIHFTTLSVFLSLFGFLVVQCWFEVLQVLLLEDLYYPLAWLKELI